MLIELGIPVEVEPRPERIKTPAVTAKFRQGGALGELGMTRGFYPRESFETRFWAKVCKDGPILPPMKAPRGPPKYVPIA